MNIKGGLIFLILAAVGLPGFFLAPQCSAAGEIVINEIAWAGSSESSYDEWLELKNNSDQAVDLGGWKIEAQDGSPEIFLSGVVFPNEYFLLERTDDNSSPAAADMIYSGSLDNDGEYLALKDGAGNIIDVVDMASLWTAGSNSDKTTAQLCAAAWISSPLSGGTPKASNDCDDSALPEEIQTEGLVSEPVFRFGDLLINEIYPDPAEGEDEWVELYNPSGARADLDGWFLLDGSGAKTVLSGFLDSEKRFLLIEKPKGLLNNSGDVVELYSSAANLIDRAVYGEWGSSSALNAPAPDKGFSLALKIDGRRESYFSESFSLSSSPTPGKPNIISAENIVEDASLSSPVSVLAITEIFSNPVGSDRENEFIEFWNQGQTELDLSGWRLEIEGGKSLEFGRNFLFAPKMAAGAFFVLWRRDSLAALDNDGGSLRLFAPEKSRPIQILEYPPLDEGRSFADSWTISSSSSALTKKFIVNSLSPERWLETGLPTPGFYNEIWADNRQPRPVFSLPALLATGTVLTFDASDSLDEDGDELFFSWDFGDGSAAEGEVVSHIFQTADQREIKLTVSDGLAEAVLLKKIFYQPVLENPLVKESIKKSSLPPVYNWPLGDDWLLDEADSKALKVSLYDFQKVKIGQPALVEGLVFAEPGVLGKQYFYLIASGSPTLEIYNYHSDFPSLVQGELVLIEGEAAGERQRYLKISGQEAVKKIGSGSLPSPQALGSFLTDRDVGFFVSAAGEIEKDGSKVFLNSPFGRIRIFLKAGSGLSSSFFEKGGQGEARGLVIDTADGPAIAPRGAYDLSFGSSTENLLKGEVKNNQVKAEEDNVQEWVLPARSGLLTPLLYLLIILSGLVLLLIGLLLKMRADSADKAQK